LSAKSRFAGCLNGRCQQHRGDSGQDRDRSHLLLRRVLAVNLDQRNACPVSLRLERPRHTFLVDRHRLLNRAFDRRLLRGSGRLILLLGLGDQYFNLLGGGFVVGVNDKRRGSGAREVESQLGCGDQIRKPEQRLHFRRHRRWRLAQALLDPRPQAGDIDSDIQVVAGGNFADTIDERPHFRLPRRFDHLPKHRVRRQDQRLGIRSVKARKQRMAALQIFAPSQLRKLHSRT